MSVISEAAGAPGPYRRLLGEPALRGLAVADVCARLPQGMVAITLLLVAATHASMTTAGLVVAGYTLGQAVTGPLRGRLADRYGLARVCAACGCGYAVALLGLLAGSLAGSPAWLLVAAAAAAGLIVPPLSPGMRSLWSALRVGRAAADRVRPGRGRLRPRLPHRARRGQRTGGRRRPGSGRRRAARADRRGDRHDRPAFRGRPAPPRPGSRRRCQARRPRDRCIPPSCAACSSPGGLLNAALSATEVALTGYVRQHHALWAAGPLLAGVSAGSIVGSLLLGARGSGALAGETGRRLPRLLACYALGLAALTAASLYAPLIAVAAPLAGLCLGPSLATLFNLASSASGASGGPPGPPAAAPRRKAG